MHEYECSSACPWKIPSICSCSLGFRDRCEHSMLLFWNSTAIQTTSVKSKNNFCVTDSHVNVALIYIYLVWWCKSTSDEKENSGQCQEEHYRRCQSIFSGSFQCIFFFLSIGTNPEKGQNEAERERERACAQTAIHITMLLNVMWVTSPQGCVLSSCHDVDNYKMPKSVKFMLEIGEC